jgi:serine protease
VLLVGACVDETPLDPIEAVSEAESPPVSSAEAVFSLSSAAQNPIPDRYIILFNNNVQDVPALARQLAAGSDLHFVYTHVVKGFAATLPAPAIDGIRLNPNVEWIEQDQVVTTSTDETAASWGLDRIDQRALPLNNIYSYNYTGAGVTAYIVDTGIRFDHVEFGGRAAPGFDAIGDGRNGSDCVGHGTHVAGIVGGRTYGVAKAVRLVSVRVLNCSAIGTWSQVMAGFDWIAGHATRPAVANISLGGGLSSAVNTALRNMIAAGIQAGVSAGNSNSDACLRSPSSTVEAITVGATTSSDGKATFSNWGSCVDLFAPGIGIKSALHSSTTAIGGGDGTSVAAPHATGVAALFLQTRPTASAQMVADTIAAWTTKGVVTGANSVRNNLLFSKSAGTTPPAIVLNVTGVKVKGIRTATLRWSGVVTTNADVFRNGVRIVTYPNFGVYTDNLGHGGGWVTYRVCDAGSSRCSQNQTVSF